MVTFERRIATTSNWNARVLAQLQQALNIGKACHAVSVASRFDSDRTDGEGGVVEDVEDGDRIVDADIGVDEDITGLGWEAEGKQG
jgi:hypothetical protein